MKVENVNKLGDEKVQIVKLDILGSLYDLAATLTRMAFWWFFIMFVISTLFGR